ncbi:MAG: hypothetical protein KAT83_01015 [Candidatus Aenigmarchaeota archaeon]|nr:hypothetical protein [Candidatus Aenigmarchaeota archaeon]
MIPDKNVKVTALQVAAFHDGGLYSVYPNKGPLKQKVHIPGDVLNGVPPLKDVVKHFEGIVSDMGYSAPPSFSVEDIFSDNPSVTEIRAQNKIIGSLLGTEIFSSHFLYDGDPKLVRETVESIYSGLEIDESALRDAGMQIIMLDVKMNDEPTFMENTGMYHSPGYRTPVELKKLNMSPAVKYLVTKRNFLFE